MSREFLCRHETDNLAPAYLHAISIEKNNSRGAKDIESLQEFAVPIIVVSNVGLEKQNIAQRILDRAIGKRIALHFLARHAPVRVEVQHHRGPGGGDVRLIGDDLIIGYTWTPKHDRHRTQTNDQS